ncbi:MAG: tRNA (adenosine(37)-N6)-threonylcarbamoyltransferase complex ATPase subunit type 1 TsaE [Clostridia bacterium]|jgi:tRNA threonylcarbamoyladenosine biosynthesis protein TsaE|nr:tRNA (adenosine(37)-N6)-threonylcarbamoyltransferase complex ATPase subunit type 1 TsaE [Clostridia bacterium]
MKELITKTATAAPEQTEAVAAEFAKTVMSEMQGLGGDNLFIALYGDVGVGKTVFVRGLASVICPDDFVQSPTYALVNEYRGKYKICHYDMYRITSEDDLESTGFYDYRNCVIVAEWCENIPFAIPDTYYRVEICKTDDGCGRSVTIEKISE